MSVPAPRLTTSFPPGVGLAIAAALFVAGCTGDAEPLPLAERPVHLKTIVLADATETFAAPSQLMVPGSDPEVRAVADVAIPSGLQDFRFVLERSAAGVAVGGLCRLVHEGRVVEEQPFGGGEVDAVTGAQSCALVAWTLGPGLYRVEYEFGPASSGAEHTIHLLATGELPPWQAGRVR